MSHTGLLMRGAQQKYMPSDNSITEEELLNNLIYDNYVWEESDATTGVYTDRGDSNVITRRITCTCEYKITNSTNGSFKTRFNVQGYFNGDEGTYGRVLGVGVFVRKTTSSGTSTTFRTKYCDAEYNTSINFEYSTSSRPTTPGTFTLSSLCVLVEIRVSGSNVDELIGYGWYKCKATANSNL